VVGKHKKPRYLTKASGWGYNGGGIGVKSVKMEWSPIFLGGGAPRLNKTKYSKGKGVKMSRRGSTPSEKRMIGRAWWVNCWKGRDKRVHPWYRYHAREVPPQ